MWWLRFFFKFNSNIITLLWAFTTSRKIFKNIFKNYDIQKYFKNYELAGNIPFSFEYCNINISLTVYDEKGEIIYSPINKSDKKAYIVKINNNRYHALKPKMSKEMKLKKVLSEFTHKETTSYMLSNIEHWLFIYFNWTFICIRFNISFL